MTSIQPLATFWTSSARAVVLSGALLAGAAHGADTYGVWTVTCRTDRITDLRLCMVSRPWVSISVDRTGRVLLLVGIKHRPRTAVYIRSGDNPALTINEPGWRNAEALPIIRQMLAAPEVATRYTHIIDGQQTHVHSTNGLAEALDAAWTDVTGSGFPR